MPFGTFTAMLTAIGALMSGMLDEFSQPWEVLPVVAAGLVADVIILRFDPTPRRMPTWMLFGAAVPFVLWTTHFELFAAFRDLGWTAELRGGRPSARCDGGRAPGVSRRVHAGARSTSSR